jgi:hypothetical protein
MCYYALNPKTKYEIEKVVVYGAQIIPNSKIAESSSARFRLRLGPHGTRGKDPRFVELTMPQALPPVQVVFKRDDRKVGNNLSRAAQCRLGSWCSRGRASR